MKASLDVEKFVVVFFSRAHEWFRDSYLSKKMIELNQDILKETNWSNTTVIIFQKTLFR